MILAIFYEIGIIDITILLIFHPLDYFDSIKIDRSYYARKNNVTKLCLQAKSNRNFYQTFYRAWFY
ncbi:hypothetical protein CYANOKiyG1_78680 [Okeania sp. KiyG1]|nr:hypothetical protein CYANOKiyG1_78680 [Okeania sp. KiyG1]